MDIKLNKVLQKKLDDFLENKNVLLEEFMEKMNRTELVFTIKELSLLEHEAANKIEDNYFAELYNIYIGEIILKYIEGEWSIGKIKKDPAYMKPIILKKDKTKARLCPIADWFNLLKLGCLQEGVSGMVLNVIEYENYIKK